MAIIWPVMYRDSSESQEDDEVRDVLGLAEVGREGGASQAGQDVLGEMGTDGVGDDQPGTMVLTRTPCLPCPVATYMVSVLTPAFETP